MYEMSDVNMIVQSQMENEENSRKKRIQLYKSILNYYKGRSLSLEAILVSKQQNFMIDSDLKNYDDLVKTIRELHDDISLIHSLKDCVKLINNSLTCTEIMSLNHNQINNFGSGKFKGILNKIEGIIYFSKSIMKLYSEQYNELDLIEKKKKYSTALAEYGKKLDALQYDQLNGDSDEAKKLENAELRVYKINLIRRLKAVFIGFISVNCPEILPEVQQFRSPVRRNLTIEDFNNTWDVGFTS